MAMVTRSQRRPSDSPVDTYSFTLLLSGLDQITDEVERAVYSAGCDDALLGTTDGQAFLNFDRQARSMVEAIQSAIKDVERSGIGIKVTQVVPPGDREIQLFNALLKLRADKPELSELGPDFAGLVEAIFKSLAR
ncbi:MAG TPA: hypothetical protein VIK18_08615 [Pirellulales bacterium]